MKKPVQLSDGLYLIDAMDLGVAQRTGAYLIEDTFLTLIETSASPSIPHILQGIEKLGYLPEDLKYIIVTHIHLDHAGGAGLLLSHCPNAKVVVHPKGARHLIDPSRLIAGARAVYKEKFDLLFDPIVPIPEERIVIKDNGESLSIGDNTLEFFDTPGHANHHFSIYYPKSNGMFTGDTSGVFYPQLKKDNINFFLPSTSPNQFDPEKMLESINFFESKKLSCLYFGHYGMSEDPGVAFEQVRYWLDIFIKVAEENILEEGDKVERITNALMEKVTEHLLSKGIESDHEIFTIISLDLSVCAMGLVDYLLRKNRRT